MGWVRQDNLRIIYGVLSTESLTKMWGTGGKEGYQRPLNGVMWLVEGSLEVLIHWESMVLPLEGLQWEAARDGGTYI